MVEVGSVAIFDQVDLIHRVLNAVAVFVMFDLRRVVLGVVVGVVMDAFVGMHGLLDSLDACRLLVFTLVDPVVRTILLAAFCHLDYLLIL